MRKHTNFFILWLFSAAFAAVFLFALQPQAANGASADNMDMGEDKLSSVITMSKGNVGSLFRTYLNNPAKYDGPEYTMAVKRVGTENIWLAGYNVSGKSNAVKGALRSRAVGAGLLAEDIKPYTGGDTVYMRVR